jgi:hypothetical protein
LITASPAIAEASRSQEGSGLASFSGGGPVEHGGEGDVAAPGPAIEDTLHELRDRPGLSRGLHPARLGVQLGISCRQLLDAPRSR